ncbi:MAG: hypothetical protein RL711_54 [Bacteroidota bacterium]|jgi:transglutaminase-like putative cysteine protease
MKFKIASELTYDVYSDTTFFFNIQAAPSLNQSIVKESLLISDHILFEEFTLINNDTRFIKLQVEAHKTFTIAYEAEVLAHYQIIQEVDLLKPMPIMALHHEVLPYIAPSRHCESDKLIHFSTRKFGHLPHNYAKVMAINDWIFESIDYRPGSTSSNVSACDTLIQRMGVCKDFAHLAIALCRAIDIPARYFTGYAFDMSPPDLHACFEAYLGGHWIVFDPTRLASLNSLVKISHGKDASEVAVASYYGNTYCSAMTISCEVIDHDFVPFRLAPGEIAGLAY